MPKTHNNRAVHNMHDMHHVHNFFNLHYMHGTQDIQNMQNMHNMPCVGTFIYMHSYACICMNAHACVHVHACICMHAYACMCMHTFANFLTIFRPKLDGHKFDRRRKLPVHACIYADEHAYMHVLIFWAISAHLFSQISKTQIRQTTHLANACMHAYTQTCMHACIWPFSTPFVRITLHFTTVSKKE